VNHNNIDGAILRQIEENDNACLMFSVFTAGSDLPGSAREAIKERTVGRIKARYPAYPSDRRRFNRVLIT